MRASSSSLSDERRHCRARNIADPETVFRPSRKLHRSVSAGFGVGTLARVATETDCSGSLEIGMELAVNRKSSTFISYQANGPTFVELVLTLDDFILRLGDICGKRKYEILGNALLQADSGRGISVITPDERIDLQTCHSGHFADLAADLAQSLGQHSVCAETGGSALLGSLASGDEVNDVDGGQWRIGNVAGFQLFDGAADRQAQVVLVDGGRDLHVHNRFGLVRIGESDNPALQVILAVHKEN